MKSREELGQALAISAVERETGLSKDTLRMWERRYGFPEPARDTFGDRLYPSPQVDKLRVIRRLMDQGHRPGKIIHEDLAVLLDRLSQPTVTEEFNQSGFTHDLLKLLRDHRVPELRSAMQIQLQNLGLRRFILELAIPMTQAAGEAWFRGELAIFEEHLFTEAVQNLLRKSISEARVGEARAPRVLLTTLPSELHAMGLLMVEAIMTLEGVECISFGIQLPINEIVQAASIHAVDIVALSFSQAYPKTKSIEGIYELRRALPAHMAMWVGGGGVARAKRLPEQVTLCRDLESIPQEIARWRQRAQ